MVTLVKYIWYVKTNYLIHVCVFSNFIKVFLL